MAASRNDLVVSKSLTGFSELIFILYYFTVHCYCVFFCCCCILFTLVWRETICCCIVWNSNPVQSFLQSVLAEVVEMAASRNDLVVSKSLTGFSELIFILYYFTVHCYCVFFCCCCILFTLVWRETICCCISFSSSIIFSLSPITTLTLRYVLAK